MNTRSTVQRQLILHTVQKLYHPTAEDVYEMIVIDHPNISKATVYRNLNLLAETGKIRRVQLLDAAVRFDGQTGGHYHAQCRKCGHVLDIMEEQHALKIEDTLSDMGFSIEECEILVKGLCAQCKKMESSQPADAKHFDGGTH